MRTSSLVDKAFWNFLGASILTTVAAQLAVSTDAAIVSHLMGPHAMAAVNLAMPVLTTFLSLNSLLGVGASLLAAKAIGSRDSKEASRIFSAALYSVLAIGLTMSAVCLFFCDDIARLVCADDAIRPMVHSYVRVTSIGVTVLVLSGMMNMMVQSDGRPRLVTCAVMAGAATNVVLDFVFIKFLDMGIAGSAWATVINYAVTMCITASHLRRPSCSYRLMRWSKAVRSALGANLKQGLPLMIANVLLSAIVLLINKIVGSALGADGVYMVAVCIQMLLITFVVLNGVLDAMFAIGGALLGEGDITGLKMLASRVIKFTCAVVVPFSVVVLVTPGLMASLFGADDPALRAQLCRVLRIFSLILLPFSLTVLLRGMYQVLGHLVLSTVVAIAQVALIVVSVYALTLLAPALMLWWGFPLSAAIVLAAQVAYTHHKAKNSNRNDVEESKAGEKAAEAKGSQVAVSPFTLIPAEDERTHFSTTVTTARKEALAQVAAFLQRAGRPEATITQALSHIEATIASAPIADVSLHITPEGPITITVKTTASATTPPSQKQAFGLEIHTKALP